MILCVSLNPALDKMLRINKINTGEVNRARLESVHAGGKAINVAFDLKIQGDDALVTGFIGGKTGKVIVEELKQRNMPYEFVRLVTETRTNMNYIDDEGKVTYDSWWGFPDLPNVNENDLSYRRFIFGKDGVVDTWTKLGASGISLDVSDKLPDGFIRQMRDTLKSCTKGKGILVGEVWEDASNKCNYRHKYIVRNEVPEIKPC